MAKLIVKLKDTPLEEILLHKFPITIGREKDNDVSIDNLAISRYHAKIFQDGSQYGIEDLNSGNGTFVNDKKVKKDFLQNKDEILVGKHTLVFLDEEETPVKKPEYRGPSLAEKTVIVNPQTQEELIAGYLLASLAGSITILSGGDQQQRIKLSKQTTMGGKSHTADIKLRGFFVGNPAFIISKRLEGFFITHAQGKRMTRVNGELVRGQRTLQDGDIITIGATHMQFHSQQPSD
jgi:pSer/pThr/pTyr-binding forkhead associated (FHA) protein